MFAEPINRRRFLTASAGLGAGLALGCDPEKPELTQLGFGQAPLVPDEPAGPKKPYRGPNVILVRFGGGVRRLETILQPEKTFCPFMVHELAGKHGVLFNDVQIESAKGVETSHGQGTLYILTGKYEAYQDRTQQILGERFEAQAPTIFEYFRKIYDVPEHQSLIVNGEDRIQEEFYTFSNHHIYGVNYRSTVLSLYRFKSYLLREDLKDANLPEKERTEKEKQLEQMEKQDYRRRHLANDKTITSPELDRFWAGWKDYYGRTGLVNPRGDRVLTALALRAIRELRPKLMMINYQDPDYVHWGNPNFYTRSISIIDEGVREIYNTVQADEEYRNNTVFVIVPDCGRDNNRCMSVPFQHHFGSKSSHEIFCIAAGPGIAHPRVAVDKRKQQIGLCSTIGKLMKFPTRHVDPAAGSLDEMLA